MQVHHLSLLRCCSCANPLRFGKIEQQEEERVVEGILACTVCSKTYPIKSGVPRFVPLENYSSSFGFQWNRHASTQYDSFTNVPVSRERLFKETRWPEKLVGQTILEAGSGSGRFTEPLASTGATIVSLDYSYAVDANAKNNGHKKNVLIIQASIYNMPLDPQSFDKVLCIGVLQHTPSVETSFQALVGALKPGGDLVVDVYRWRLINFLWPRYWLRSLTKRLSAPFVYRLCRSYVNLVWPLTKIIHRLPQGRKINRFILVPDFRDVYPLSEELLREWAILDTFDNLSPAFDQPQRLPVVVSWFKKAKFENIDVHLGYNGIEGRGRKSLSPEFRVIR